MTFAEWVLTIFVFWGGCVAVSDHWPTRTNGILVWPNMYRQCVAGAGVTGAAWAIILMFR